MASRSRPQPGAAGQAPSQRAAQGSQPGPSSSSSTNISVSLPTVSLPKSGGAIRDMGEKFEVNAATGTGSMKVDIPISKAREGMQPSLSLSYNSGSGNGPFGLGWGVAIPNITRKTDKGLPCYYDFSSDDKSDVFIYGGEDLVPVFKRSPNGAIVYDDAGNPAFVEETRGDYVVRQYRPRIEDPFSRIERWLSTTKVGGTYWRIISKDNLTNIYGRDGNSQIVDSSGRKIFTWFICETYDVLGNAVIYNYKPENSANVDLNRPHEMNRDETSRSTNRYLKSINYGNRTPNRDQKTWVPFSAFTLSKDAWMFSIVFDYGDHNDARPTTSEDSTWLCRNDPISTYRAGYEVRTYRLCQRILMFHHFPEELGLPDCLVNSTKLIYNQNSITSYLDKVMLLGHIFDHDQNQYLTKSMPPVEFTYTAFPSDQELLIAKVNDVSLDSLRGIPGGVDGKTYQFLDLDGEGVPGIFTEQGAAWYYSKNLSSGDAHATVKFGPMEAIGTRSSGLLSGGELRLSDLAGDGHLDIVQLGPDACGFYRRSSSGAWLPYREFASVPKINFGDSNVRFLDITGNGLADILISGDEIFTWYPSLGEQGYGTPRTSFKTSNENTGPRIIFADPDHSIYLADMSGDGLSDVVRIRNGDVCYWPNLGYGLFGGKIKMDNSPWFDNPPNFNQQLILIADIDGSGTSDIIYLTKNEIRLYLNESGNGFSDPKVVKGFPAIDNISNVTALDILGSGTTCLVWSSPLPGSQQSPMKYIDLMKGVKPNLLIKTVNNLGGSQVIHYVSSTKFYQADKAAGKPWATRLAFPVYVVEKVEHVDSISRTHFATRYAYHHGYFDGFEREFRGFAMVEQWDTEDYDVLNERAGLLGTGSNVQNESHVPPIYTKTWFHTGAFLDGDRISLFLAHEYFGAPSDGDDQGFASFLKTLLPDTVLPPEISTVESRREACRALKGQVLRSEVYAVDGNPNPYTVGESNYTLEVLQGKADAHFHCSYMVHARESITYTLDRQLDDPRVQHEMSLQVDDYGQPMKSLKIAYGRSQGKTTLTGADQAIQETALLIYDTMDYTDSVIQSDDYLLPKMYQKQSYQLYGAQLRSGEILFHLEDFVANNFAAVESPPTVPFETVITNPSVFQKRLLQRSQTRYRKNDLSEFLPAGKVESMAIRGESYQLSVTPGMLANSYIRDRESLVPDPGQMLGGQGEDQGGYVDLESDGQWWMPSGKLLYDASPNATPVAELSEARAHFFQALQHVSPFDQRDTIAYDSYDLFPTQTQDAAGNINQFSTDYRVLKPCLITDPNGNRNQCVFDELGFNVGTATMGKVSESLGDTLQQFKATLSDAEMDAFFAEPLGPSAVTLLGTATIRGIYHVRRLWNDPNKSLPTFSATISRTTHGGGTLATLGDIQITFSFSDGSGHIVQNKAQAEPGPLVDNGPVVARWLGTGWKLLNNKGMVIKEYEPFFDDSHDFKFEEIAGVSIRKFYDPVGRTVATLNPDHSWTKTIFSPWKEIEYDQNDTVMMDPKTDPDVGAYFQQLPDDEYLPTWYSRTITEGGPDDKAAAAKAAVHANTPSTTHKDPMNRNFIVIDDNGVDGLYTSHQLVDVLNNVLVTRDALDRVVEMRTYDMSGNVIHISTMDAGDKWALFDAAKNPLYAWDSRNQRFRTVYDQLRRASEMHYTLEGQAEELISKTIHGESVPDAVVYNLRTQVYQTFDQAGLSTNVAFDFKGNLVTYHRQISEEYKASLDWSQDQPLEQTLYTTTTTYDALNRVMVEITPDNTTTAYTYNVGGQLKKVDVNLRGALVNGQQTWENYTSDIDYNSKGQRLLVTYGNGAQKKYTYDPLTFRLLTMVTKRNNDTLQSLEYHYDPSGNVTSIRDLAQQDIFFRNQRVEPSSDYTYDAIYRITKASGREQLGLANGARNGPTAPAPIDRFHTRLQQPGDGNALGTYTETYKYDSVGNILSVQHAGSDPVNPGWTRQYAYNEQSLLEPKPGNRLSSTTVGGVASEYSYDSHGNMTLPHLTHMEWDFMNKIKATARQNVTNGGTPETTWYVYNASGTRVRKVTERYSDGAQAATRLSERLYLGKVEIYRKFAADGKVIKDEKETFHVMDDEDRVAIVESQTVGTGPAKLSRYQFTSLVDSVALELDDQAQIVSYEEYTPFGTTSYQGVRSQIEAPKRYRFTGKECDNTGLYYHGARYYAPWLGRWTSPDPIGTDDGFNLYCYVKNNPISRNDPTGHCGGDKTKKEPEPRQRSLSDSRTYLPPTGASAVLFGSLLHPLYDTAVRLTTYTFPLHNMIRSKLQELHNAQLEGGNLDDVGRGAVEKREDIRTSTRGRISSPALNYSKALEMGSKGGGEGYDKYRQKVVKDLQQRGMALTPFNINYELIKSSGKSRGSVGGPATIFAQLMMTTFLGTGMLNDHQSAKPDERNRLTVITALTVIGGTVGSRFGGIYAVNGYVSQFGNMKDAVAKFKASPKFTGLAPADQAQALKKFVSKATNRTTATLYLGYIIGAALTGGFTYKASDYATKKY